METKKTATAPTASETTAAMFARMFTELSAPAKVVPYLVAQVAYETGDFKSKLL